MLTNQLSCGKTNKRIIMASSDSLYTMPLSKVIQLKEDMSFPDDIVIFEESVSDKHRMTGFYDTTMDAFTCRIYKKEKDEKEQGIGLRIDAVRRLLTLFPRLEGIKQRYEKREMQTHYRYEIADGIFVTMGKLNVSYLFLYLTNNNTRYYRL